MTGAVAETKEKRKGRKEWGRKKGGERGAAGKRTRCRPEKGRGRQMSPDP